MFEPLVGVYTRYSKERSCTREHKIAAFLSQPIGDRDSQATSGKLKSPQTDCGEFWGSV